MIKNIIIKSIKVITVLISIIVILFIYIYLNSDDSNKLKFNDTTLIIKSLKELNRLVIKYEFKTFDNMGNYVIFNYKDDLKLSLDGGSYKIEKYLFKNGNKNEKQKFVEIVKVLYENQIYKMEIKNGIIYYRYGGLNSFMQETDQYRWVTISTENEIKWNLPNHEIVDNYKELFLIKYKYRQ